jgi:hypothetical protein
MLGRASVSAAIATLAMSLGALAPISAGTAYAATCNAAPKSPAPQGQHWYYRTDRNLGRKCWYLASEGRKGQAVAPRTVATEPDEDTNAQPAAAPMTAAPIERQVEPKLVPTQTLTWPAADAGAIVAEATPSAPVAIPPADSVQRNDQPASVPSAPESATTTVQNPGVADQTPAVAAPAASAVRERINMLQFVFVAFAGICFLVALLFYLLGRRRRTEIRIVDLNTKASLRMPTRESRIASPSLAPADMTDRRDDADVDQERLRQFSQAWKRQAA